MKTVPENDSGLDRHYDVHTSASDNYDYLEQFRNYKPKSCFYDPYVPSTVEFSGIVDTGDSDFITEVEKCFN